MGLELRGSGCQCVENVIDEARNGITIPCCDV